MPIPEILTSVSGEKITTKEQWETYRRKEIMALFENFVYGVRPIERPTDLAFEATQEKNWLGLGITRKTVTIRFAGYSFKTYGFLADDAKGNIPCFDYIMHEAQSNKSQIEDDSFLNCVYIDILEICRRGYGIFITPTYPLAPDWDSHCNYREGIYPLYDTERKPNSWATISAWSCGLSRVLDYIETDADFDASRVITCGHSRGGKTALWAAATDTRFYSAISNCSGCTGAALLRGKLGEHIKDINITDWFCENYHSFNDNEEMLPVDQHMLLAAIAPRPCYVASASEDEWADPKAERLSCRLAKEVYALYGKTGIVLPDESEIKFDTAYHAGDVGHHTKTGVHGIVFSDWKYYLDFFDKELAK